MPPITCPTCGEQLSERPADGTCPACGVALDAAPAAPAAPPSSGSASCPVCGEDVAPNAKTCESCGVDLAQARAASSAAPPGPGATHCPVCGDAVVPGARTCESCGVDLAQAFAASAATAAPVPAPSADDDFCPACGAPRKAGAAFCRECGEPFPARTPAGDLLSEGEFLSGRYRIERKLGGGGMGAVFLARDMNLEGKHVAVKAVLNSDDPALLQAAAQEAMTLLGVQHPNFVLLRDLVRKGSIPLIVMEYLEGPDWNDLYEQRVAASGGAFTAEEALKMILGILPAFEYFHGRRPPLVYRDFKPGQVKLVRDAASGSERQVLLDLGVVYAYEGRAVEAWGTPGYAPPEIGGVCLQPPSMDLACICRTLEGLLGIDLVRYGYGEMPERADVAWVPEELYDLIQRGTAREPRRRFQTLTDLRAQLEGVLRLIQGREGTLPRPAGALHLPVVSRLFTGNLQRTRGDLLALPVPATDDPAAAVLEQAAELLLEGTFDEIAQHHETEALKQIEEALKLNPRSSNAQLLKSIALAQMGRRDEAREQLQQISRLNDVGSDWSYVMVAAQVAESSGELDSAEQLYRDLIRLVPGELPPRQKLANLLIRQGRPSDAIPLYQQIVGADPANVEAILHLADALATTGNDAESIRVLQQVGQNAVRFVDAQSRMIELLLARAHRDPAALNGAAQAIEALQERSQTPRYYRLLGDWWFEAYQHMQANRAGAITKWPLTTQPPSLADAAQRARDAYQHYLRVAPTAPDVDEVIGRIHFGIRQMM